MKARHVAAVALCLLATSAIRAQSPPRDPLPRNDADKPEPFSPLGFLDLLAYEQAYPGVPASAAVIQASTARYWAFRGVALRASGQPEGNVWTTFGPETSLNSGSLSESESVSGRVSALAISPLCDRRRACRLWVGTAGGGVWRTEDALNTTDARRRWLGAGLGTNNIGSLTVDPNDRTGNTIYVGTGETNTPNNSGAGTGLYRSVDGGDRWTRIPTLVVDAAVAPGTIDFTTTRGISSVVVE